MLEAEKYEYTYTDPKTGKMVVEDTGFNFTVWNRGRHGKVMTWKERFRWCWNILKTGSPWADDIIATNKDARGLAIFILKNLPSEESDEKAKV